MFSREDVTNFIEGKRAQKFIIGLIVLNAVTLGLETSPAIVEATGSFLHAFDVFALSVFVVEIVLKLYGRGFGFFKNGWNLFDFVIVGIALLPSSGPLAVLRAFRILRVLRLFSVVPQLRKVIQALLNAIPGMLSIVGLMVLIFYISAVLATNFFSETFAAWFGDLGNSFYTLFQIMTLESWSMGIVRPVMEQHPYAWAFFVPFILITSFAVINLIIGVIVDSMQSQHTMEGDAILEEAKHTTDETAALRIEITSLRTEIGELKKLIENTHRS